MTVDVVFETSFEVCNKVGGIYTVVSSKAALAQKSFSSYVLIGPYFSSQAALSFYPLADADVPAHFSEGLAKARSRGVIIHVGKWLIPGEPIVFLLDFSKVFDQKNDFKRLLWEKFGIDSLYASYDFEEPLVFSLAAGILIESFLQTRFFSQKKCLSQTHEWMTGMTNLYLKLHGVPIKTVFTTHATMLGRAMSGAGIDVSMNLKQIDPVSAARQHGVLEKFSCEKACAAQSDIFTTVSDLTAQEAKYILGREPSVVTQNGLWMENFPSFEQAAIIHTSSRSKLLEFCRYYFFPYHRFDLDNTLLFFSSGRYEFKNKGLDISIASLGKLNERLKSEQSTKTIVTFFFVPMREYGVKPDLFSSRVLYRHMNQLLTASQEQVHDKILTILLENTKNVDSQPALTRPIAQQMKQLAKRFMKDTSNAPLCTHHIDDENSNPVIQAFLSCGLLNRPDDRVKVVLYPIYLNGTDDLLDMAYYDAINGCHLGLFASFYEPWGYTPLEAAALGVPCITTTSAGYGQFVAKITSKREGIFVLDRLHRSDNDIIQEMSRIMYEYSRLTHHERVKHKIAAKLLADSADWSKLYMQYLKAYDM